MFFRRAKQRRAEIAQATHGALMLMVVRFVDLVRRTVEPMTRWTRLQRAGVVLVGMPLAVALLWAGWRGTAVTVGGLSIVLFWLIALPSPPAGGEGGDQPH